MYVFSGNCLCGRVTYKCYVKPKTIFNCHCEDCRRATGSVFGTNLQGINCIEDPFSKTYFILEALPVFGSKIETLDI